MELKQRTIASLREQLGQKQASIAIRQERLEQKRKDIEGKKKDLRELKDSFGGLDTYRVSREEKELQKQIEAYDTETRHLQWDEAALRDRSAQLRSASNHWQE